MGDRIVLEVEKHLNYIMKEGWTTVQHRLFQCEDDEAAFILALEYWDAEGGNKAGEFWTIPEDQLHEVRVFIFDMDIPAKPLDPDDDLAPAETEEELGAPGSDEYREGYREGYEDGFKDGLDNSEGTRKK